MQKFIDCFSCFDQNLLLDIRLKTLKNFGDKFIIYEPILTNQGEDIFRHVKPNLESKRKKCEIDN